MTSEMINTRRLATMETDYRMFLPQMHPTTIQEITFQFQATSFTGIPGVGFARIYSNSAGSTFDEDTNGAVTAFARFDDTGGNGTAASTSTFNATMLRVPLEDNEGRTAYYHGHWKYIAWSSYIPRKITNAFEHQRAFMLSNAVELNIPGTDALDQEAFVYYDSHANFNVSSNISMSLWFYPTDWSSLSGETYRYLLYRYIDSNNYFIVNLDALDSTHLIRVFVKEGGTETKLKDNTGNHITLNAWNLVNFTYNPSTNALVLYVNGTSYTTSTTTSLTAPYTTDSNMYIGGLPNMVTRRFTGYMDNFVFWTGKILTAGEVSNMWTKGTIV